MAKSKMSQDAKEVAARQAHEMKYICSMFLDAEKKHVPVDMLKSIMKNLGVNGKLSRSRRHIYIALKALGYKFKGFKKEAA